MGRVLVRDAFEVTDAEHASCVALWGQTWPPQPGETRDPGSEQGVVAYLMLLAADEFLVSACAMVDRAVTVGGVVCRAAGLSRLAVREGYRRRGYGSRVVHAFTDDAWSRGYDFGMLFCYRETQPFYQRLGWESLVGEVTYTWLGEEHRARSVMGIPLSRAVAESLPDWRSTRIYLGVGAW